MISTELEAAPSPSPPELKELRTILFRVEELHEQNPMLGHRGCRLGITYPEITEMQTRAIIEAAVELKKENIKVMPEMMIPLVTTLKELTNQEALCAALRKKSSTKRETRSSISSAP